MNLLSKSGVNTVRTSISNAVKKAKNTKLFNKVPLLPVLIAAAVILVALFAFAVFRMVQDSSQSQTTDNPVVAQYRERLPQLAEQVKQNPNDASARRNYAVALYATGNTDKAAKEYEKAIELEGDDAVLRNNLGNTYRDQGKYEKAISEYKKAIELNPKLQNPYVNMANIQMYNLNKPEEAISTYQDAIKSLPDSTQLKVLLGLAYEQAGNEDQAAKTYKAILANDPENKAAKSNLERLKQ